MNSRISVGILLFCSLLLLPVPAPARDIGFIESFSLAKERAVPLRELIPGTEEYYYYNALHNQNNKKFSEVENILQQWVRQYGKTKRVREIQNRQALLLYEKEPEKSLKFIQKQLGLHFTHQKDIPDKKTNYPTTLDRNLIARETLTNYALSWHSDLSGFEESALDFLVSTNLNQTRRGDLLRRLRRPDYPGLEKIVVADLKSKHSSGFGSLRIHNLLLTVQMEECARMMASLLNNTNFINAFLRKLQPNPDADWKHDPLEKEAYLHRLWGFVKTLGPARNSLKAHVLYRRLLFDESRGVYNREFFIQYLQLPRSVSYINQNYYSRWPSGKIADIGRRYDSSTLLPPVISDRETVKRYLRRFFTQGDSLALYSTYLDDAFLKETFAETMILNGTGEMKEWYAMIPPNRFKELKERVDIEFSPENRTVFRADDPVFLDVTIKNVKKLIVKIYHINTVNYYRTVPRDVGIGMNLDGLVANEETVYTYDETPFRGVKRRFEFPSLNRQGISIVELVGNGKSSRALIRKGRLRYVERIGAAGHGFTLYDDNNRRVTGGSILLRGFEYRADKNGLITIPFTNKPGTEPIILTHNGRATLDHFHHSSEEYSLHAGIYVDRESLLKGHKAKVIVRPVLSVNGEPVTLSLLKNTRFLIESRDSEGVVTLKEIPDFTLYEDRESVYTFYVPENLSAIKFTLKGEVKSLSRSTTVTLSSDGEFALNIMDTTEKIVGLHLGRTDREYVLDLLGKNGEPLPGTPVTIDLKHRDFRESVKVLMQTDNQGRIRLGLLRDITTLSGDSSGIKKQTWTLSPDAHSYPAAIHGRVGETVAVPYMGKGSMAERPLFSLLEKRGDTFVKDRFDSLSLDNGFIRIKDLPAGDYDLRIKESGTQITLRITQGEYRDNLLLSDRRYMEVRNPDPLQISGIETGPENIHITLANTTPFARVHVIATTFMPAYSIFSGLGSLAFPEPEILLRERPESPYHSGRRIGDEARYILNRKYAKKYPGNMLKRPALLLNPMRVRKTETKKQGLAPAAPLSADTVEKARRGKKRLDAGVQKVRESAFSNLDFLAGPSTVLTNLRQDSSGRLTISREELGPHTGVHVLAVDPLNTVYRQFSIKGENREYTDIRLKRSLDTQKHFTEKRRVSVLKKGEKVTLSNMSGLRFEALDTLQKVFAAYKTISKDSTLSEFGFIPGWSALNTEEKREKYSAYACHELNFFLYKKDRPFFDTVVVPYIKNKMDKTFLDHWLLNEDITGYLTPWAFGRLNMVEKILLARRISGEQPVVAALIRDMLETVPLDSERFTSLFNTVLRGSSLDSGDAYGLKGAEREMQARAMDELTSMVVTGAFSDAPRSREKKRVRKAGRLREETDFYNRDEDRRSRARQYFRKLDKTMEWAENNYYNLPFEKQNSDLIPLNSFWRDFAGHKDHEAPFFSPNVAEASGNFSEMMFALSVLDLPFKAGDHRTRIADGAFEFTAATPAILFYTEITEAETDGETTPVLISSHFFKEGGRYRYEGSERFDNYVTGGFVVSTLYGCQVMVTNTTSSRQRLDILLQIPEGSVPAKRGFTTRGIHLELEPYANQPLEYYFYFPQPGDWPYYPPHAAKNGKIIAFAQPAIVRVKEKTGTVDRASWDSLSQQGSEEEVLEYLRHANLNRIDLEKIAFRMRTPEFFKKTIALLESRHAYNNTLWSYSLYHNDPGPLREYLLHSPFPDTAGLYLDTPLVTIDPVRRLTFQHLEYSPLVNPRAHQPGKNRAILNDRFYAQYHKLMKILSYKQKPDNRDIMAVTYALLLQDRKEEALAFFDRIDPADLETKIQYDYLAVYMAFYTGDYEAARTISTHYRDYPVMRWRNLFAEALRQLDETGGETDVRQDAEDRDRTQTQQAAASPGFDFTVEAKEITITYQGMTECTVNYYLMDIELLFSRNPFVRQYTGQFTYIQPNHSEKILLQADKSIHLFPLPEQFHNRNVMVEIVSGPVKKSIPYHSHSLAPQVIDVYGQIRVSSMQTGRPLQKVYVKVYAKMNNGETLFYKDGYTDLRGRFDYVSLNTDELSRVKKFSLLIMSETHGAVIREVEPPKQ